MRRPLPRLLAVSAACLAIAAVWLLVPGQQSTAAAFNAFATALVEAKSARFQMEVSVQGQPDNKCEAYFQAPGHFRQELQVPMKIINIIDMQAGKLVSLTPANKTAIVMTMTGRPQ